MRARPPQFPREASEVEAAELSAACRVAVDALGGNVLPAGSPHAAHARGVLFLSAGLFRKAETTFQRALAVQPCAIGFHLLGLSLMALERWAPALAAFHQAIATDPDLFMSYHEAASLHRRQGRLDSAAQLLLVALRRFSGTRYESFVCSDLALVFEQQGALEEAVGWAERAAASSGRDRVAAEVNLALLLCKLRRAAEARAILSRLFARQGSPAVLDLPPETSFIAHYTLGRILLEDGDALGARRLLSRALEFSPRSAAAWNTVAVAAEATGDRRSALRAVRRALELDPQLAAARRNLAYLQERPAGEATA